MNSALFRKQCKAAKASDRILRPHLGGRCPPNSCRHKDIERCGDGSEDKLAAATAKALLHTTQGVKQDSFSQLIDMTIGLTRELQFAQASSLLSSGSYSQNLSYFEIDTDNIAL